ncbi:MAG: IS110 family transposase [Euryarchaeota archaeon]|nr:IS110 family transposase [Euryarchaeota archaeon]
MGNKFCGLDVHKDFFIATLLSSEKETRRFENNTEGILALKEWLKENKCKKVAMESSGVYWVPLYVALEEGFKVIIANSYQIKSIPGRKTDTLDSEWIAQLLKNNLIKPSYIPKKKIRELRELTRLRAKLVQNRTAFKNRIHKVLERTNIKLASVLDDIFGKSGLEILQGIMQGEKIEEIVERNGRIKKKKEEIIKAIRGELSKVDVFILKECIEMIKAIDEKIKEIEAAIAKLVCKKQLKILCKVPGIGKNSAPTIIAEIGDPKRFPNQKKLTSWSGLAPSVYQSGGKNLTGYITKKGSKWLRRIMVEVALLHNYLLMDF